MCKYILLKFTEKITEHREQEFIKNFLNLRILKFTKDFRGTNIFRFSVERGVKNLQKGFVIRFDRLRDVSKDKWRTMRLRTLAEGCKEKDIVWTMWGQSFRRYLSRSRSVKKSFLCLVVSFPAGWSFAPHLNDI